MKMSSSMGFDEQNEFPMQKVVTFGEIMLRLSPPGNRRFSETSALEINFGGGESNIAVSLATLGMPVEFVSRVPANEMGDAAVGELKKRRVGIQHILRQGDRLGIYFLETGAVNRGSKVVYDRAHSGMATLKPGMINWKEVFQGADWFHWTGITPALSEGTAAACREAIDTANQMGLTVSVDLNYRKNLWNYGKPFAEVMTPLLRGSHVALCSLEDAETHFGLTGNPSAPPAERYRTVAPLFTELFPQCRMLATSLRGSISASHNSYSGLLFDGQQLYQSQTYQITHIVDRIGGGDSFMGGLIYGLLHFKKDRQKALNFAVAASCYKHTIPGDANLASLGEVEKILAGDISGRLEV